MPLNEIERVDVTTRLNIIAETGKVNANRARSALSGLYTWAIGKGIAMGNSIAGINMPADQRPREQFLSLDEVRAVWNACRNDDHGA